MTGEMYRLDFTRGTIEKIDSAMPPNGIKPMRDDRYKEALEAIKRHHDMRRW